MSYDLDKLERLEKAATPGPWIIWADEGTHYSVCRDIDEHICVASVHYENIHWKSDMEFFCALRNAAPELLATIRRQQEEIAGLRKLTLMCNDKPHRNQCSCWGGSECDCDAELPSGPAPIVRIYCAFCGQIEEDPDTHSCSSKPEAREGRTQATIRRQESEPETLRQENAIEDYWDQNSVTCEGCGVQIIARGVSGNSGLSEPEGCDFAVCARCADADHKLHPEQDNEGELAELRKDKARIDWMSALKYACYGINCHDGKWVVQIETGGYAERGASLREAIDSGLKSVNPSADL